MRTYSVPLPCLPSSDECERHPRARSDPLRDGASERGEKAYIAAQSVDRRILDAFKDTFVGYQIVLTRRVAPNAASPAARTDAGADADRGGALRRAWLPGGRRRPDVAANIATAAAVESTPTHERCIAIRRYSTLRSFTRQLRATYGLTSARGFPAKLTGLGSVNLEQRRAALEAFFQSLLHANAAAFAKLGKGGAADALSTFVLHSDAMLDGEIDRERLDARAGQVEQRDSLLEGTLDGIAVAATAETPAPAVSALVVAAPARRPSMSACASLVEPAMLEATKVPLHRHLSFTRGAGRLSRQGALRDDDSTARARGARPSHAGRDAHRGNWCVEVSGSDRRAACAKDALAARRRLDS